jgi:hypothetical protein
MLQKLGNSTIGLGGNSMKFVGLLQRAPGVRPHVPLKKDPRSNELKVSVRYLQSSVLRPATRCGMPELWTLTCRRSELVSGTTGRI